MREKLPTKDIEELAVEEVNRNLLRTELLSPYIEKNDKTPIFDGVINVFKGKGKNNKEMLGKIDVQIKGTMDKDLLKNCKFRVETEHLRIFLANGGVLFFVVFIDKEDDLLNQIFYCDLLPVTINKYLERAKSKETSLIELKKFPKEMKKKEIIVRSFLQDYMKQASFYDKKLPSLSDIVKEQDFADIKFFVPNIQGINPLEILNEKEVYLYKDDKRGNIVPLKDKAKIDVIEKIKKDICIKGKKYYSNILISNEKGTYFSSFGSGFRMYRNKDINKMQIDFRPINCLRRRTEDLQFYVAMVEHGEIEYGEQRITFNTSATRKSSEFEKYKKELKFDKQLIKLFNKLNFSGDINVQNLSNQDCKNLEILVESIVKKTASIIFLKIYHSMCI